MLELASLCKQVQEATDAVLATKDEASHARTMAFEHARQLGASPAGRLTRRVDLRARPRRYLT